jgi:hypothetical protein
MHAPLSKHGYADSNFRPAKRYFVSGLVPLCWSPSIITVKITPAFLFLKNSVRPHLGEDARMVEVLEHATNGL